jgi:hypothetical protein
MELEASLREDMVQWRSLANTNAFSGFIEGRKFLISLRDVSLQTRGMPLGVSLLVKAPLPQ